MILKLEFQYKSPGDNRPEDVVQDDTFSFEGDQFAPIPNVGDCVSMKWGGSRKAFKVVSRYFSYSEEMCLVNIVVTDLDSGEVGSFIKE